MNQFIDVCIPNTKRDAFTYLAGPWTPMIGARIWVPFRAQMRLGIVVATRAHSNLSAASLKTIAGMVDEAPLFRESLLELCQWVSQYYQAPLSEVLPMALPKHYREGALPKIPMIQCYALSMTPETAHALIPKQALKQQALLDLISRFQEAVPLQAIQDAGFNRTHLNALLDKGIISELSQPLTYVPSPLHGTELPLTLNCEQADAIAQITRDLDSNQRYLLQGITGSGKTEIYLQVISQVLAKQRQVLVLVPEIGLTPQLVARFRARFPVLIAVIHSNLNENERQLAWYQASTGDAQIIIGTRTAIFTPLPQLGLIIIDEEHDPSLKQLDGVRYSARDTALMRAHMANIPIILGSATPSLESIQNCEHHKFTLLQLNRSAKASMPLQWVISDLRNVRLEEGLSPNTLSRIKHHLEKQNQVLVFINRRGFSPVLLCHQCGWIADCPACDSHLTLHRQSNHRLICHHCGNQKSMPNTCQKCKSRELIPVGTGTQRLEAFLQGQFPNTALIRIDRDEVRHKNELSKRLDQINQGEAQLIVGTQMMAKGHHFPKLTLVVVVEADAGFYNQDFRALERLGQLLTQVGGRAGRAEYPGEVIIQTHFPNHPLLNILIQQGYRAFAQELLKSREAAFLPPHHYLAMIRAQSRQPTRIFNFLQRIKQQVQQSHPTHLQPINAFGPAPAPMAKKANQHRMQLLLKSSSRKSLQASLSQLREWINDAKLDANIRWHIDVDPIDLS